VRPFLKLTFYALLSLSLSRSYSLSQEHLRGVEEMPAADAVKDLTSFFDKLDAHTHKTARVLASEKVVCACACVCAR
jgi:hypothetical protein